MCEKPVLNRPFRLIRCTAGNGLFKRLDAEWQKQLGEELSPDDFYGVWIDHAARIAAEDPPDKKYGIFVLERVADGSLDGLVHVNHKLPRTPHAEVRVVWSILAPKFQMETVELVELGRLTAGFIHGAMTLARTEMPADNMKMLLPTYADRQYAASVAAGLSETMPQLRIAVRGGWLHVENIKEGLTDAE